MSFIVKKGGEEIQWRHWSQLQRQTEKKERLKTNKQTAKEQIRKCAMLKINRISNSFVKRMIFLKSVKIHIQAKNIFPKECFTSLFQIPSYTLCRF